MANKEITSIKDIDRSRVLLVKSIHVDPLIKLKKYNDAFTSVGPSLGRNGRPVTGLTELTKDEKGKIVSQGTRVELEKELGLEEGTLKPESAYWSTFFVRIDGAGEAIDLADAQGVLYYLFLRAQSHVCEGLADVGTNSKHEFVLYSEEQEAEEKVSSRSSLKKAYILADSLDIETKMNILTVYGIIADASRVATIDNAIDERVEANPDQFLAIASDKALVAKSLVTRCINAGILDQGDGKILHGETVLGYDKESSALAIIKEPKLAEILEAKLSGDNARLSKVLAK